MVKKRLDSATGCIIGVVLHEFGTYIFLFQPFFFPAFFQLIGILIVLYYLLTAKYHKIQSSVSPLFDFFCIWTLIMILRGSLIGNAPLGYALSVNSAIDYTIKNPYSWIAFVMPLIAKADFNLRSLSILKKLGLVMSIICLISIFLKWDDVFWGAISGRTNIIGLDGEYMLVRTLITRLFPCFGLIVLFSFYSNYIGSRLKVLFTLTILIYMYGMVIGGGRSDSIIAFGYILTVYYLYYKYQINSFPYSQKKASKWISRITVIFLLFIFAYIIVYLINSTTTFDFLFSRLFNDGSGDVLADFNREGITNEFMNDFNNHPLDWIFGRGVNGSYICTELGININGRRQAMEWGYLYIILKGGIVYLVLGTYFFLHAAWQGLFKSNNMFSKACALMCLWQVINLASTRSEPKFALFFVLSWFCFGLLENKNIRMLSDSDFWGYFNNKRLSGKL